LKIKTVQKGKFPVVGFVKDPTGVAALYHGKPEGNDLVYSGEVGTGWSRTVSSQIRKKLDTVVSPKSKLTKPMKMPKATWVEPSFTAEIEYRDITLGRAAALDFFHGAVSEIGTWSPRRSCTDGGRIHAQSHLRT
jgi:bifunctional non-homologous end joining protein LigD